MKHAKRRDETLEEALARCNAMLRTNPHSAAVHLNKGVLLHAMKRYAEALASHDRAVELDPGLADAHYNRANTLRAVRRLDEALQSYDHAIVAEPEHAFAYNNRGNLLREMGRLEDSLKSYGRAIELKPDLAEAHYNSGEALHRTGRFVEALQRFDSALALDPGFAEAWYKRGNTAAELKRWDEARRNFDEAIARRPNFAEAYNNKGNLLRQLGRLDDALGSYTRAIGCRGDYALAWNNRSIAFGALGRLDRALSDCDRAVELDSDFAEAHYNRGNILKAMKRLTEARQSYDHAIALKPDFADAHWNKGVTSLIMGEFDEGWRLYEWRTKRARPAEFGELSQPSWTGAEPLDGRTLLIVAEQGFGDTIQFSRYVRLAEARGANVILAVQDRLKRLLGTLDASVRIVAVSALPSEFDYYVRLLSLPFIFETRLGNIPARVPYIRAEQDRIEKWKGRVGSEGVRIGICWQGAKGGEIDIGRSFHVRMFERIAQSPGVRLISLQKYGGEDQLLDLPAGMHVECLGEELDPGPDAFIDTAAVMECVDLVITSDTAIAHLAGALGRPAWIALSYVPDWRWLLNRSDSPWYPTLKLFRQKQRDDWETPFAEMEFELRKLAGVQSRAS